MAARHNPHPRRRNVVEARKKLEVGHYIASEKYTYRVESILGSGGFGDVYKVVVCKNESTKYAMKTEYHDPQRRKLLNRLKVEMGVFTEIQQAASARKKHFILMVDKGQTDQFKFIVMEIVSHSLEDIRKYMLCGKMSWSTVIRCATQTLAAISDLHSVGYIHRDIKPHNFAIGRPPLNMQIYMLDFGIARRYIDKSGRIRVPRERVTFLGTVKFASRHCHMEKEQCRMDDLEVWMYMVLELFEQENLIWRRQTDRMQILLMKEQIFTHPDELDLRVPFGFKAVIETIRKLSYVDEPDYEQINQLLLTSARMEKLDLTKKLDWIDRVMPEKPQKKVAPTPAEKDKDKERDKEKDEDESEKRRQKEKERKRKQKEKEAENMEDEDDDEKDEQEDKEKKEMDAKQYDDKPASVMPRFKESSNNERIRRRTTSNEMKDDNHGRKKDGASKTKVKPKGTRTASTGEDDKKKEGKNPEATKRGNSKEALNDGFEEPVVKSNYFHVGMGPAGPNSRS